MSSCWPTSRLDMARSIRLSFLQPPSTATATRASGDEYTWDTSQDAMEWPLMHFDTRVGNTVQLRRRPRGSWASGAR